MNIWLINPYGPILGEGWRDYRFSLLGKALAERGHQVIWWTGNFSHHFKKFRSQTWKDIPISPGFIIRLVPTTSYTKNIGLDRLRFEAVFARNIFKQSSTLEPPCCIIGVDPPQIIGFTAVQLSKRFHIPLILDVFDLWPELFVLALPKFLRPVAPVIFSPFYWIRKSNLNNAKAIVSLCETYLHAAKEQIHAADPKHFLTAYNGMDIDAFRMFAAEQTPANTIQKEAGELWAVYAGSLGNNYDIRTLLSAAHQMEHDGPNIRFLIAGDGPFRSEVIEFIKKNQLKKIVYLGRLTPEELAKLYYNCDIGICAYAKGSNVAMPDKAYDYMAAGLPIVNSLNGELEYLLINREMGINYIAGDANSLYETIKILLSDPEKRAVMAHNSYLAAKEFDCKTQYLKYSIFVENMVQN